MHKKGFTLIEIIVVLTIFGIVGLVSLTTFLTAFKIGQRSTIQNAILDDARYIMNTIAAEIQNGTIDYEEYFNQCVIGQTCPYDAVETSVYSEFGNNHGYYNWQFKYGGLATPSGPSDGYGNVCQDQARIYRDYPHIDEDNPLPDPDSTSCITGPLSFSDDVDTGQNPNNVIGGAYEQSSAVCADVFQRFTDDYDGQSNTGVGIDTASATEHECPNPESSFYNNVVNYTFSELYLINETGDKKTIIVSEMVSPNEDRAVSKVEMIKTLQGDIDGRNIPLTAFECDQGYTCSSVSNEFESNLINFPGELMVPNRIDAYKFEKNENIFEDFVPISPLRVNVKNLKFIIAPLEDPRRAFAETDPNIQMQPQVTILMEIEPSSAYKFPFISDSFNLKLQTTVTAGVLREVPIVSDL